MSHKVASFNSEVGSHIFPLGEKMSRADPTQNTQQSSLKAWPIAVLLLRLFTFLFLIASIIILVTDSVTLTLNFRSTKVRFKDVYAYRYVLSTAVIGLAYTMVQIPFAIHFVTTRKRMAGNSGLLYFDFVADKVMAFLLISGVGAGFGASVDLKNLVEQLVKALEYNGLFNVSETMSKLDRFFNLVDASTGLLLAAFLCMAGLSVLSSLAVAKRYLSG